MTAFGEDDSEEDEGELNDDDDDGDDDDDDDENTQAPFAAGSSPSCQHAIFLSSIQI